MRLVAFLMGASKTRAKCVEQCLGTEAEVETGSKIRALLIVLSRGDTTLCVSLGQAAHEGV